MINDFCIIICAFIPERLEKFLPNFKERPLGVGADVYFIHNLFKNNETVNRFERTEEDRDKVSKFLFNFNYPNKVVINRENIGEDLGAYHFAFNLLKDKYKYFFFLNEAATINKDFWLKDFYDLYEHNDDVVAASPQV